MSDGKTAYDPYIMGYFKVLIAESPHCVSQGIYKHR